MSFPASFAGVRRSIRRLAVVLGGPSAERVLHRSYHRILRSSGSFEIEASPHVKQVLSAIASGTSTLIDVGANVGRFAWYFSQNVSTRARIYAFEPNPDAYRLLAGNLRGVRNARCFPLALGSGEATRYLHVPADSRGNPLTPLGWIGGANPVASESVVSVEGVSLDGWIDRGHLAADPPVLVKLDVEGAEQEVLEGAERLIAKHKPVLYFECEQQHLERDGRSWEPIWEFLTSRGYGIWAESDGRFTRCSMLQSSESNYFAIDDRSVPHRGTAVSTAEFITALRVSHAAN